MSQNTKAKKRLVVNFHNLPAELQEQLKKKYPFGFTEDMIRIDKPNGEFFYAVVFETEDISYLVQIDVKVDGNVEEEEDKDYYDDEIKGAEDIADSSDEDGDDDSAE